MRDERRRFGFYHRLSAAQKREYDRSDALTLIPLAPHAALGEATNAVIASLATRSPAVVRRAAQLLAEVVNARLAQGLRLSTPPAPLVKVLRTRPRKASAEFHGLYTLYADGRSEIRVWMFTAARGDVVKPRTFLRTLLHELCHHFDMALLGFPSSIHTLGFHARESSLVRALERSGARIPGAKRRSAASRTGNPDRDEPERAMETRRAEPRRAAAKKGGAREKVAKAQDAKAAKAAQDAQDAQDAKPAKPAARRTRQGPPRQLDLFSGD